MAESSEPFSSSPTSSSYPSSTTCDGLPPYPIPCEEYRTFWCLIQGNREPFKVTLPLHVDVYDLKEAIHAKGINTTKSAVLPKDLVLWKLSESEPLEPDDNLVSRVSLNLSEIATKPGPSQKISTLFPQQPPLDCLHIILQAPADTASQKRSSPTAADDDGHHSKKPRTGDVVLDKVPPTGASIRTSILQPSVSDFASLANVGMFVDKSPALQDFLKVDGAIHLLLRPRRSGKTTLLRMFRDFFECKNPEDQARRKDLFTKNNLAIVQDVRFEKEFGKYPVMYLDFSNVASSTMANLLQKFKYHVVQIADRLEGLGFFQNRGKLCASQQEFLEAVLKGTLPDSKLSSVLLKLTEVLHELLQRKVMILIDEYDTPMSYAARHGYFPEANEFFRRVFSKLLKNNEHLRGALLVGILRVAMADGFSGLNNISVFPLGQTTEYSTACMFTEDETRMLYDRQDKLKKLPFTFNDLQKWYNGYPTLDGANLFNPWSISNALTWGRLYPWWNESGYDSAMRGLITNLLKNEDKFCAQYQTLLNGDTIVIDIDLDMSYNQITEMSTMQLWTLMFYAGYLTNSPRSSRNEPATATVCIPNGEIRSEFRNWVREDFSSHMTKELYDSSIALFRLLVDGNFPEFAKTFGDFILTMVPQRIFGSKEAVYQDYLYAYFCSAAHATNITPAWTTMMEIVAGDGRADMIFHQDRGIIIELKRYPHLKKEGYRDVERGLLSHGTGEGLGQRDTCHYRAMMPKSVTVICQYSIAFLGPYCGVEARILERVDGEWVTGRVYTTKEDEERRQRTYCRQ